ncbi:hypothetical protein [Streptococcus sp. CSL10205-OR2]|uniref:hypothetical protein n=1 Tax=Streptococcus sp. CSL10205-OR2 TaxID=2980558 RepID=UPI0021DB7BDF|nr:hypothetical protein [Streptococcus sp. CSL10205-OR2]MCU9534223.1 hypothetical protein [Streptococcus sp. CSL10205-OR2]
MDKKNRVFPLVADNEAIIEAPKLMKLYDNEDLITNINGHYVDKNFDDMTSDYRFVSEIPDIDKTAPERVEVHNAGKSYAAIAREEARQDIKKKRQAYLSKELSHSTRSIFPKKVLPSFPKHTSDLHRIATKLQQEDYILADIATSHSEPKEMTVNKKQKNSYDFLKKSQIYNKKEMTQHKEKKIAQELNLTRFEDIN